MTFIPLKPKTIKNYIDRMVDGISIAGRRLADSITASQAIVDELNAVRIQEADIGFWRIVKASIEYLIDYANNDADELEIDEAELNKAYLDLQRLIAWIDVVYGETWAPELCIEPTES